MKHLSKMIALILVFMLLATFGIGCQKQDTPEDTPSSAPSEGTETAAPEESAEPTTIQFLQWWASEGNVGEELDRLVAKFESEHPEIKVDVVTMPFGDTQKQIVANNAADTVADVVGMNPPWTREFVDLGILEPLDDYMANDPNFNKDDYFPASMAKIKGHTYLAPYNTLSFFLFYNKDIFADAGLDMPETWDDIVNDAKALTDIDNNKYGFTMSMFEGGPGNGSILTLYPLLYAANGRTLVDGKYTCETPEMLKAMNFIKTLSDANVMVPGENVKSGPMMVEEFSLGNVAMMIQNDSQVASLKTKAPDLNYSIIPIPTPDGNGKPDLRHHGWDIGMTAKSEHKDAAWTFISFLLQRENMKEAGIGMSKTPSMYGIEPPEDAPEAQKLASQYLSEYNLVEELMAMPSASACWVELTKAGVNVLNGDKTPEEALADCQAEWDKILEQ